MSLNTRVLFVSAEAVPYAKVGGLADVVGSLPQALRKIGVDARVIMPMYGFINTEKYKISYLFSFPFARNTGTTDVQVFTAEHDGVPFYFVRGWPFFGSDTGVYTTWDWDVPRFIFFNQVVMAVAWELRQRLGWFPDVFHVNDWHTGLLPFLLYESRHDAIWGRTASVLGIHNLAYQGESVGGWLWQLGIPGRQQADLVYQNLTDNMLAIAIGYSDILTTVSPRYAVEIQYPYMGHRLDSLIRTRTEDLYGILNGIDVDLWNPETDPNVVFKYNAENFVEQRQANKRHLQNEVGLPVNDDVPIIGIVTRLVWQKGFTLALPALRRLLVDTDAQVIALGSGEAETEHQLWRLGHDFHWKARVFLGFNAATAQHIYAGSDIFLMPSHYEPCGIGQMIAMRYGSLPLVRETGGLADTVQNYDNNTADTGTGFVFTWEQPDAVLNTLRWSVDTFRHRQDAWRRMQKRAMQTDFSWHQSAHRYVEIYQKAMDKHRKRELEP
ncbi:MAG: glycogen synthase [Anaerolineaceae bacterium]|nr:glycogen synthase [Anaerolineaceae bacterium]